MFRRTLLFLAVLLVLSVGLVYAQAETPPAAPNLKAELAAAIVALTPIAVRLLVWGAFFVVQKVPKALLPVVALAVSGGASYLSGLTSADPVVAGLVSLAAIGLREVVDRYLTKPLGLAGLLTGTEGSFIIRLRK